MTIVWVNGSPQNSDGTRYDPFADPANYRNGVYAPNQDYINPDHPVWYGDPNPSSPYYGIFPYTFTTEPDGTQTIISAPDPSSVGLIPPGSRTAEDYTRTTVATVTEEEKKTLTTFGGLTALNPIYSVQGLTGRPPDTLGSTPTTLSGTQASLFSGITDIFSNPGKLVGYGALAYGALSIIRRKRGIVPLLALAYGLYSTGLWKQVFPVNSDGSLNVASTVAIAANPLAGLTASGLIPAGVALLGMALPYIWRSMTAKRSRRTVFARRTPYVSYRRRRYYR